MSWSSPYTAVAGESWQSSRSTLPKQDVRLCDKLWTRFKRRGLTRNFNGGGVDELLLSEKLDTNQRRMFRVLLMNRFMEEDLFAAPPPIPRAAEYLLFVVLPHDTLDEIAGDLSEKYSDLLVPKFGKRKAQVWYWRQVIGILWRSSGSRLLRYAFWGSVVDWIRRRV